MQKLLSFLPELFGPVLAWRIGLKPLRVLLRVLTRALVGVGTLFAFYLFGFPVVPNLVSLCVCAVFGLPGTALILALSALL